VGQSGERKKRGRGGATGRFGVIVLELSQRGEKAFVEVKIVYQGEEW